MKKVIYIATILILWISGIVNFYGQPRETITRQFRQQEIQSWSDFIHANPDHSGDINIDVEFYHLDIEIAIDSAYIIGEVLCRFESQINGLNEIRLDLDRSLTVDDVGSHGTGFYQDGDEIVIQLADIYNEGEKAEVVISYQGVPVLAGGYKGLRYEVHNGDEPIIATLSTPFVAHYWYPCKDGPKDKPDSVYMDISIEDKLVNGIPIMAVSNGILENITSNGNKKTFQWRHRYPIVTYYVMVAISNYIHFTDEFESSSGEPVPLDYYAFSEVLEEQQEGVINLPEAIGFFEEIYGTYPFHTEKYGMTQLGYYGGIENQTNTIINSMDQNWFMVSVHELAHMWFADMITCETWNHAWLNEGFATYSEALWVENDIGEEAYKAYMDALKYWNAGTIYLENPLDTFNVFSGIIYYKGAWALHMLRGVVGDSLFFESVNNYAQDENFMYQNATTEDLQHVFETTSNTDLNYFFDQWVYDDYYPIYHYNFVQVSNKLFVMLYQAQEELFGRRDVFDMPVDIKIDFTDDTDTTITVWNDEQLQQFGIEIEKPVYSVLIDPDERILRKVYFKNNLPVSIDEKNIDQHVKLYPNPAKNLIHVEIVNLHDPSFEIKIYNLTGQEVISKISNTDKTLIDLSNYPEGVYVIKIRGSNLSKPVIGKIIKE